MGMLTIGIFMATHVFFVMLHPSSIVDDPFSPDDEPGLQEYETVQMTMFTVLNMMLFGAYDIDTLLASRSPLPIFFFVTFMIVIFVIFLNLLIGEFAKHRLSIL